MSRKELDRFCRVFEEHGGLPIVDDDLAASALSDLVLDMGYDPIWATAVLVSAISKVNRHFERDPKAEIARALNDNHHHRGHHINEATQKDGRST